MTPAREKVRRVARLGLSLFFVAAGLNHFVNPAFYLSIMPPYMPWHEALVATSGVLEIVGGLAVLRPRWQAPTGLGLALLLLAVFPANVHMALNADLYPTLPAWALYARLPVQGLLILWALWATGVTTREG